MDSMASMAALSGSPLDFIDAEAVLPAQTSNRLRNGHCDKQSIRQRKKAWIASLSLAMTGMWDAVFEGCDGSAPVV